MRSPKRHLMRRSLGIVAVAFGALAGMPLMVSLGIMDVDFRGMGAATMVVILVATCALVLLVYVDHEITMHFEDLERLRGDILMVRDSERRLPRRWSQPERPDDELRRLASTVADLIGRDRIAQSLPNQRLAAVVGAVADGLVVVTDSGLVSLINGAAAALLGQARAAVGTSIYAALERESVITAATRANRSDRPVETIVRTVDGVVLAARIASLGQQGGTLLSFQASPLKHEKSLSHDLSLHDEVPALVEIGPETPLIDLPAIVLDTETTGLSVQRDRVVSIGAVRVQGMRVFHQYTIDRLVNPLMQIPPRSTAIHGITNAMVAGAPLFGNVAPELAAMIEGTVVVGHNIAFDLAILRREAQRTGVDWSTPPSLDTGPLMMALEPGTMGIGLDALAERFGVEIQGRHTALGDCLVTAEIFVRMIPRLQDHGVATLGQAVAFQGQAKTLLAQQRAAGWSS